MIMGNFNDYMKQLQDSIDSDASISLQSYILNNLLNRDFVNILEPFHNNYMTSSRFHTFKHLANNSSTRIDY